MSIKETIDFDEQGRLLLQQINLDTNSIGLWDALNAIYVHTIGKGIIYVGNQYAANNLSLLKYVILY